MQLNKDILNTDLDAGFVIQNGVKILIKRQRFEQFLDELSSI
ncbi:excisionase [Oscillibacter sp. 1-3]